MRTLGRSMWRPHDWQELKALEGTAEESATLDFKREASKSNPEIAKDIAALTVNGGVLIYGLEEDKATKRAKSLTPVVLAGFEERLRSVAGTRIFPTPQFDLTVIRDPDNETRGVIVVAVQPSVQAPHWVGERFPIRRGTITEYLTEHEIERLYEQRRQSSTRPQPAQLSQEFREGFDRQTLLLQSDKGTRPLLAQARLLVRPLVPESVVLPGGPWQGRRLAEALALTQREVGPALGNPGLTSVLQKLHQWTAVDVYGWRAGDPADKPQTGSFPESILAATMSYPGRLSFHLAWGLADPRGEIPHSPELDVEKTARELDVIREIALCLSFAGAYFADIPGAAILISRLELHGFEGAKSSTALAPHAGRPPVIPSQLPPAPDNLTAQTSASAFDLRDNARIATQTLVERWLPPFYSDPYDRSAFELVFGDQPAADAQGSELPGAAERQ